MGRAFFHHGRRGKICECWFVTFLAIFHMNNCVWLPFYSSSMVVRFWVTIPTLTVQIGSTIPVGES
jgi:hypothetical protein